MRSRKLQVTEHKLPPKSSFALIPATSFSCVEDRSGSKPVKLSASTSRLQFPREQTWPTHVGTSRLGRFCCKSRFALVTENSAGRGRGFRVKM